VPDIYKYILLLLFISSPVLAQDYRPPSLDFEIPKPQEETQPTQEPMAQEMIKPEIQDNKPVPKPMPPRQTETKTTPSAEITEKPNVREAEPNKVVQPEKVRIEPLKAVESKKPTTSSAKDISLVLTYEDSTSKLTQAHIGRLQGMLGEFKTKKQFHIHAYANTTDSGNVGFARSLSLSRALAVREWFINNGIKAENMTVRALGQAKLGTDSLANSVEIFTGSKS